MSERKNELKERQDIDIKYIWDLESMYGTDEKWEEDFMRVKNLSKEVEKYIGKVGENSKSLLEILDLKSQISRASENVFVYAKMRLDEDSRNDRYQALTDRANSLMVEAEERMSFITPEILMINEDNLKDYIEKEEGLKLYKQYLDEIVRIFCVDVAVFFNILNIDKGYSSCPRKNSSVISPM